MSKVGALWYISFNNSKWNMHKMFWIYIVGMRKCVVNTEERSWFSSKYPDIYEELRVLLYTIRYEKYLEMGDPCVQKELSVGWISDHYHTRKVTIERDGNNSLSIKHLEEIHIFHRSMDLLISSIHNNNNNNNNNNISVS